MRKIISYIAVLSVIVACAREEQVFVRGASDDAVSSCIFGYRVDQMCPAATKSNYISSYFDDAKITGITLAAYDHTTGILHCSRHFTDGFDNMKIKLHGGSTYDLYALANMGDRSADLPSDRNTLLEDYTYTVPSYADVNGKGIPMTGRIENYVAGSGADSTFGLRRLFAKVTLTVNTDYDGGTEDGIRVTELKVGNANSVLRAFSNSRLTSASERLCEDDYALNSTVNASSVVFYVPENRQGTIGTATASRDKNPDISSEIDAMKDLLTYVDVTVSASSRYYTGTVHYRSYVGADATTDFNVIGNKVYVWNMTLTEDGLVYDDWKIEQDLTDGRYLRFLLDTCLVEAGDVVRWEDILETNLLWDAISRTYSGDLLYETVPDATGFTVRNDGGDGSSMRTVFGPAQNWSALLTDTASFVIVSRYLNFDREIYSVNPRKTISSHIEYGNSYSGPETGRGGFGGGEGLRWTVTPPDSLPHSLTGTNCLDYSYDPLTDSVSWTPARYAAPGDYPIICQTLDGKHSDTALLHVNDTRWINTQGAYAGRPRETSIPRTGINSSTQWNIGYAFGDLSVSDDGSMTSTSPNAGYYAGNSIVDEWQEHIGYSLVGNAARYLSQKGTATHCSNSYSVSRSIPPGDYIYRIYWKDTWSDILQDYAVRDSAVLHIIGTYVNRITVSPTTLNIKVGETAPLSATIANSNATLKKVSWQIVSGEGCICIVQSGDLDALVTGLAEGTATVRAVAMDGSGVQSNICTVNVTKTAVSISSVPAQYLIYNIGGSNFNNYYDFSSLPLEITYSDGSVSTGTAGSFGASITVEDGTAVMADGAGVTARERGTATVVINCEGKQASFETYVSEIRMEPVSVNIPASEETVSTKCHITPYDEWTEEPCDVFWLSANPEVVTVTANYGSSTSVRKEYDGYSTTVIYAVYDDLYGQCTLIIPCTVYGDAGSVTHYLEILPEDVTLAVGETQQFVARYHTVTDGTDDGGQTVVPVWESSDTGVVSIDAVGMATAIGSGTATVTAEYPAGGETCTATATITVTRPYVAVRRLEITPSEATICEGSQFTYSVRMHTDIYYDGVLAYEDPTGVAILNTQVLWNITEGSQYATVNDSGVASGVAPGDAMVEASYKNDLSITAAAVLHVDADYNVEPGTGGSGSGGGNY